MYTEQTERQETIEQLQSLRRSIIAATDTNDPDEIFVADVKALTNAIEEMKRGKTMNLVEKYKELKREEVFFKTAINTAKRYSGSIEHFEKCLAEVDQEKQELMKHLNQLKDKEQKTILYRMEGYTIREIADKLNVDERTVYKILERVRKRGA